MFVSLANRDKRVGDLPDQAAGRPRLPRAGHRRAPRRCCAATGCACEVVGKFSDGPGQRASSGSSPATSTSSSTRPFGSPGNSGPRLDGYEIRTAAVAAGIPCITTVQGMAAAVQGVEALRRGDIGVRSLQERPRRADRDARVTAEASRA